VISLLHATLQHSRKVPAFSTVSFADPNLSSMPARDHRTGVQRDPSMVRTVHPVTGATGGNDHVEDSVWLTLRLDCRALIKVG
jgi:aromatic ring-cleaving dioxygenase